MMKEQKVKINLQEKVVAFRSGNFLELTTAGNNVNVVKKIDKDHYINLATNEVKEYIHNNERAGDLKSLQRTFTKIRRIVLSNFSAGDMWLTLTYAQDDHKPVRDTKKVYRDFQKFWRKFKTKYGPDVEYFVVLEPQASGSWHLHCLIKSLSSRLPFIDNNGIIAPMWGQGFTKMKRLKSSDNVAAYLTAYLSNVAVDVEGADGKKEKRIVKGARLHYYPSGTNIYRRSRGIKNPIRLQGSKAEILQINNLPLDAEADFSKYKKYQNNGRNFSYKIEFFNNVNSDEEGK